MKKTIKNTITRALNIIDSLKPQTTTKITFKLNKASASRNATLDKFNPYSWEFSGFSQNGEDGIISYLTTGIKNPNKYFVEIGASNGLENNTSYLAIAKGYSGLMIDGDKCNHIECKELMNRYCMGVECMDLFVDKDTIPELKNKMLYLEPDVFSLDIDGNDYYLAKTIIDSGIRPKIFVVEYNSAFGPEKSITINYDKTFRMTESHPSLLYYGVSLNGWKNFFEQNNYQFICVDSNGINGFFVDKKSFYIDFFENIKGFQFRENFWQFKKFKFGWEGQFQLIKEMDFYTI